MVEMNTPPTLHFRMGSPAILPLLAAAHGLATDALPPPADYRQSWLYDDAFLLELLATDDRIAGYGTRRTPSDLARRAALLAEIERRGLLGEAA